MRLRRWWALCLERGLTSRVPRLGRRRAPRFQPRCVTPGPGRVTAAPSVAANANNAVKKVQDVLIR